MKHTALISAILSPIVAILLATNSARSFCSRSHLCPLNRLWAERIPVVDLGAGSPSHWSTGNAFAAAVDLGSSPTPAPSSRRAFGPGGNRPRTPSARACFTSSFCRRREYCGACQRPVWGFFCGRNGFGTEAPVVEARSRKRATSVLAVRILAGIPRGSGDRQELSGT